MTNYVIFLPAGCDWWPWLGLTSQRGALILEILECLRGSQAVFGLRFAVTLVGNHFSTEYR